MRTGLTSGSIQEAWWRSHRSAYSCSSSGLGRFLFKVFAEVCRNPVYALGPILRGELRELEEAVKCVDAQPDRQQPFTLTGLSLESYAEAMPAASSCRGTDERALGHRRASSADFSSSYR